MFGENVYMNTKNHQIRIVIYIIIGAVIAAVGVFLVIHSNNSQSSISLQDKLDLGHKYLVELSYDKAVLEFTDAIEIDPMNADAYLGLADAYIGQGDTDKAVEVLEKGFDKTGDDRIMEKLDELKPVEETTITTVSETTAETTVVTYELAVVPNLVGLTEVEASQLIKDAGLKGEVKDEFNETVEKGYVISQMIPADAEVGKDTNVIYSVSKGKEPVVEETTVTTIPESTTETAETNEIETIRQQTYDILVSFYPYMPKGEPNSTVYAYSYLDTLNNGDYYCFKFIYDSNGDLYKEYQIKLYCRDSDVYCSVDRGNIITYKDQRSEVHFEHINGTEKLVACEGKYTYSLRDDFMFNPIRWGDGKKISENEYEYRVENYYPIMQVYTENGAVNRIECDGRKIYYDESSLMWRADYYPNETPYKLGLPKNLDPSIFDVEDKIEKIFPNSNEMDDYIRSIQQ